jgi:hypothetical protein
MAPGRMTTNTSAIIGTLREDLPSSTASGTIHVRGVNGAFSAQDTYIGGETLGVSGVTGPVSGVYTLTVSSRNKYPCHANYPPRSNFILPTDSSTGAVIEAQAPLVTQGAPIAILNRTAALYIGHLKPNGEPDAEANAVCRLIGRITEVNDGIDPGAFEFSIESVVKDLDQAKVAPGLAHAFLNPGILLGASQTRRMFIQITCTRVGDGSTASGATLITVDNGGTNVYEDANHLKTSINAALAAAAMTLDFGGGTTGKTTFSCDTVGTPTSFALRCNPCVDLPGDLKTRVTFSDVVTRSGTAITPGEGLMHVMGWDSGYLQIEDVTNASTDIPVLSATAPNPVPRVFVPLSTFVPSGTSVNVTRDGAVLARPFFSDQGDGSGFAYARFNDGIVATVLASTGSTVTLGSTGTPDTPKYYYSPALEGEVSSIEQIVRLPSKAAGSSQNAIGQLLASKGYSSDGEYNVFPAGVGLGFDGILDKDSIRSGTFAFREDFKFDVDATTKFMELFGPMAKVQGMFLVWNPATTLITLRTLKIPNYAASSSFQFTESNRPATGERSKGQVDRSTLRTGWTYRYGWEPVQKKFLGQEININDEYALNSYQGATRTETIEDRTIPASAKSFVTGTVIQKLIERSYYTRIPWLKVTRTVNKTALLQSPGTYHKIVDNTIRNPFTGLTGIRSADEVYGFLIAVSSTPAVGKVNVTFLINQTTDGTTIRPWAPTALVDFAGTSGGCTNGYNNGTGLLLLGSRFGLGAKDGLDFVVGDKINITTYDCPGGSPGYTHATEIYAIATDGSSFTVDAGLGALDTALESIVTLQDVGATTTDRLSGDHRVTFQGSGDTLLIDGTYRLHKWN